MGPRAGPRRAACARISESVLQSVGSGLPKHSAGNNGDRLWSLVTCQDLMISGASGEQGKAGARAGDAACPQTGRFQRGARRAVKGWETWPCVRVCPEGQQEGEAPKPPKRVRKRLLPVPSPRVPRVDKHQGSVWKDSFLQDTRGKDHNPRSRRRAEARSKQALVLLRLNWEHIGLVFTCLPFEDLVTVTSPERARPPPVGS